MIPLFVAVLTLAAPPVKTSGWVVFWDEGASLRSLAEHRSQVHDACFEWIVTSTDGRAVRRVEATPQNIKAIGTAVGKAKIDRYAMTSNSISDFVAKPVQNFLATEAKTNQHIDDLLAIVQADRFDGVEIDYESLEQQDRAGFTRFMALLSQRFHSKGLKVSLAVHPKTSEPGNWGGPQAQDWAAIGKVVDVFRVMAYDEHWSTSQAGPIASHGWTESVMKFAVSQVAAKKVEWGIPGYGYNWSVKPTQSFGWSDWRKLLSKGPTPARDPASQELVLTLPSGKVFFADGEAQRAKCLVLQKLGLRGTALWRFGSEDPGLWPVLRSPGK